MAQINLQSTNQLEFKNPDSCRGPTLKQGGELIGV